VVARLNLLERQVVVDVLRRIVKIDDDFNISVGQKSIDRVGWIVAFVKEEVVDKLIQRESRDVDLSNHHPKIEVSFEQVCRKDAKAQSFLNAGISLRLVSLLEIFY
jgi:hypothetical protein